MKISIKGILLSGIGALIAAFLLILPAVFVLMLLSRPDHPPFFLRFYAFIAGLIASAFQGFLLAKIAGESKFPGSVIVCAILAGITTLFSKGILWGVGSFFISFTTLWFGSMFAAKKN